MILAWKYFQEKPRSDAGIGKPVRNKDMLPLKEAHPKILKGLVRARAKWLKDLLYKKENIRNGLIRKVVFENHNTLIVFDHVLLERSHIQYTHSRRVNVNSNMS